MGIRINPAMRRAMPMGRPMTVEEEMVPRKTQPTPIGRRCFVLNESSALLPICGADTEGGQLFSYRVRNGEENSVNS